MLEREIDIILQTVTDRTIGPRISCSLERVLSADIPAPVKVYLQAEVEHWLEKDLRASARFSRLDDQAVPYLDHVTRTYLRSVANAYRFTRDEFITVLDEAVHFVENYLCRPQWTLENFLFHQEELILLHQFQSKLRYFSEYRYLITLLERSVNQRGWTELHCADVRALIRKIDEQVLNQHSPRELANLTRPIFNFLMVDEDPPSQSVSLRPLLVFFEDKGLLSLRDHIKETCLAKAQAEVTLNELAGIIESFPPDRSPRAVPLQQPVSTDEPGLSGVITQAAIHSSGGERTYAGSGLVDLQTKAHDDFEIQTPQEGVDIGPAGSQEPAPSAPDAEDNRATSESPPPSPTTEALDDLQSVVTYEQRQRFIRKLFGDDEVYYTVVLTTLNSMATWKDASSYLEDFFEINRLDPYIDEVTEFTDIVHQRYPSERDSSL